MISYIIISYNESEFIKDCIRSCINQNANLKYDYEIIVGDDGSTDGSIDQLLSIEEKNKKVKHFVMERSEKEEEIIPCIRISNIIKQAFKLSKGEFIQILSADDLLCNRDKISKQISFLLNNKKYSACYTDAYEFDEESKEHMTIVSHHLKSIYWYEKYIHISCFLYTRRVFNNLLERFCDDLGIFYSSIITGKIKRIPIVGFAYRQRNNSVFHNYHKLDNSILNVMTLQDILNQRKMVLSSLGRFCGDVRSTYKNKNLISKSNIYRKYLINSSKYDNDILNEIVGFNNSNLFKKTHTRFLIIICSCCHYYLKIISTLESAINRKGN